MKFAVISDVHADINPWDWALLDQLPSDVTTIVVAGDINNDVWDACHWLVELRKRFPTVIWTPGNHDFYNLGYHQTRMIPSREWDEKWPHPYTVDEIYEHYARWSQENGIYFLNRSAVVHDGVTFVGATGWHDYVAGAPFSMEAQANAWANYLNDSRCIKWARDESSWKSPLFAATADAAAIKNLVNWATGPTVVVTHYLPHRNFSWQKPHDRIWTALHGSFVNTVLEDIQDPKIRYWIYGHTHQRSMRDMGPTTYVCNARGYPHENERWEPIVLEI